MNPGTAGASRERHRNRQQQVWRFLHQARGLKPTRLQPTHVASSKQPAPRGPALLSVPVASRSPGRRLHPPALWCAIICTQRQRLQGTPVGLARRRGGRGTPRG